MVGLLWYKTEAAPLDTLYRREAIPTRWWGSCGTAEWRARVDLAAAYRILENMNMVDGINNHLTVFPRPCEDDLLCVQESVTLHRQLV